ncbi:hypothetical protein MF271_10855 [Deinococcus sp. KNUC1210]|uniref:hypothetical protein n=1 Tax=Deinococcus sp. KNUC1210 TaxID=2917691 RepID=UPI001EF10AB6|nr:hypothetical protein [Deinococcus sp. KNUC1210]ULH14527.1 hypothetical protein MF271_10855 [Deinococcus sp. KNUC1210]
MNTPEQTDPAAGPAPAFPRPNPARSEVNQKLSSSGPAVSLQRPRFDQSRATLTLLLLSAAALGLSALHQTHLFRSYQDGGQNRVRSVWDGVPRTPLRRSVGGERP